MDPDALRSEADEWVRDGIITEEQAEEILARYDEGSPGRSRVVLALSIVGSALVFAGIALFLATNWEDLSRAARTAVLVAGPTFAYAGGALAYDRNVPRIGHALCILGAVLVGPSVFLFEDLYALGLDEEWLLLAWTTVALPTGHALASRAGTGLGLALLAAIVVTLAEPADPVPAVGLLGVLLLAVGHAREGRVPWTYRVGGAALTVGTLVVMTQLEGQFGLFDLASTTVLAPMAVGALAGIAWLAYAEIRPAAEWAALAVLGMVLSTTAAVFAPDTVPELLAFVFLHVASLSALLATGYLGYRSRSRALIDLATIGGLLQTLSFVEATVVDALSGSVALVVAGLLLLTAGVALERGRRSLLSRF